MRYLRTFFLVALAVALVSGTALAGTLKVNHATANTAFLIGVETLGQNRPVSIVGSANGADASLIGSNNAAMMFSLGTGASVNDVLNIQLTGTNFLAATYNLCATNTAAAGANTVNTTTVGTGIVGSATPNLNVTITSSANAANLAAGNFLILTSGTCGGNNVAVLNVSVAPTSAAGFLTAGANLLTGSSVKDPAGVTTNTANVVTQFSYGTINANSYVIDYLVATAKNGSQLILPGGTTALNTANTSNAINLSTSTVNFGVTDAGLTVAELIGLTDSTNWQGVARVYIPSQASTCALANNIAANTTLTGATTVNLSITGGNISTLDAAAAANTFQVCVDVTNTAALSPRTLKVTPDVNITGTGSQDKAAGSQ